MPTVSTNDGVELRYRVDDFRDPWIGDTDEGILLHHGLARSMKWWTQWIPALARRYKVVRYDCRGCGRSSVPPAGAEWSPQRLALDALTVADHVGLRKIHWIGFESGGIFGIVFATLFPDRISSLVLVNTPYKFLDELTSLYEQGQASPSEAIRKLGWREWLTKTMAGRMDLAIADKGLVEWHIEEHSKTPQDVAVAYEHIVESADVSPLLSKIRVPTLIMTGDRSVTCPVEAQLFMQRQIPNARPLVVFPGIGAGIQLLIPDKCTDEALRFLTTL